METITHNSDLINNKPKLLFFAGSARKDSLNVMLANNAFEIANKLNCEATFINLKDYPMPICDGSFDLKEDFPKKAIKLKKIFIEHDGFFLASPEYNSSISPLLKNTLDWISRSHENGETPLSAYRNKIAILASASPGMLGGSRGLIPLQMMLGNIGVIVLPKKISIAEAYDKFNENGLLINSKNKKDLEELVEYFVHMSNNIKF